MFIALSESNILLNTATVSVANPESVTLTSGKTIPITEGDYKFLVKALEAEDKRLIAFHCPR